MDSASRMVAVNGAGLNLVASERFGGVDFASRTQRNFSWSKISSSFRYFGYRSVAYMSDVTFLLL